MLLARFESSKIAHSGQPVNSLCNNSGGAGGNRTRDLFHAKEARCRCATAPEISLRSSLTGTLWMLRHEHAPTKAPDLGVLTG